MILIIVYLNVNSSNISMILLDYVIAVMNPVKIVLVQQIMIVKAVLMAFMIMKDNVYHVVIFVVLVR